MQSQLVAVTATYLGQLSLDICSWVGTVSISETWGVNSQPT